MLIHILFQVILLWRTAHRWLVSFTNVQESSLQKPVWIFEPVWIHSQHHQRTQNKPQTQSTQFVKLVYKPVGAKSGPEAAERVCRLWLNGSGWTVWFVFLLLSCDQMLKVSSFCFLGSSCSLQVQSLNSTTHLVRVLKVGRTTTSDPVGSPLLFRSLFTAHLATCWFSL